MGRARRFRRRGSIRRGVSRLDLINRAPAGDEFSVTRLRAEAQVIQSAKLEISTIAQVDRGRSSRWQCRRARPL